MLILLSHYVHIYTLEKLLEIRMESMKRAKDDKERGGNTHHTC